MLRTRDNIVGAAERRSVARTRRYLRQLRDLTASQSSDFLVILIPGLKQFPADRERYKIAENLMAEMELPYMDLDDVLLADEDYASFPDVHWNSAGHQKVGAILSDCIRSFIASGRLDDCEYVVMP